MTDVYAALLTALERDVLHAHCDAFLRGKLAQTLQSVEDAAVALQRLRDVTFAAQKLQAQDDEEPLHMQLKALCKLRRKVARAFRRVNGVVEAAEGVSDHGASVNTVGNVREQAADEPRVLIKTKQAGFDFGIGDGDGTAEAAVQAQLPQHATQVEGTRRENSSSLLSCSAVSADFVQKPGRLSSAEERVETPQVASHTQSPAMKETPAPVEDPTQVTTFSHTASQGGDIEQTQRNKKRRRESDPMINEEVRDAIHALETRPDIWELYEALWKLSEHAPDREFVTLVHNEICLPGDFQNRDLASQVAAVRSLAEGIKALSSAPMCKYGSEITPKQRLMVAAVIAEAVHFFTTFVLKQSASGELPVDASELFTMLECMSSTMRVFKDSKATLARLRQSERDLAGYVQAIRENEFQKWDLERKQTMNKRRQFENIRTTLESWIQSEKCRGSALDRLMDQFERLLTNSLALWDVTKDDVIRACVEQMATVASIVDGSIEKQATRASKLNIFRNILSSEVPPTTRATGAMNYQMRRDDASA